MKLNCELMTYRRLLQDRGLATVGPDPSDTRVRLAGITDEGARVLSQALALWKGVQVDVREEFGEPRLRSLYGELSVLTEVAAG